MGSLARRCAVFGLVAASCTSAAGALAGSVRILPWLFAPDVPWRVSLPFARALLSAALDVGISVGTPIGFVLGAAVCVRRGEARALAALGVSPCRMALGVVVPAFVVVVGGATAGSCIDAGASIPGRFASELVHQGRNACGRAARTAWVPVVNVTWICFSDAHPRIVAPVPGGDGRLWYSASDLKLSDDLTEAELRDFTVASRAGSTGLRVRGRAERARIHHLPGWGRPPVSHSAIRRAGTTAGVLGLVIGLVWLVLRRNIASTVAAGGLAVAAGFLLLRGTSGLRAIGASATTHLFIAPTVLVGIIVGERLWNAVVGRARARTWLRAGGAPHRR